MLMSKRSWKRAAMVLLLGMLIGVGCAVPQDSVAETITWETDYCLIKFDWNGTWTDVAYWAYGMYLLDIPDWAYLFGVYGMGWDHIWGSAFWGPDGTWGAEDKVVVRFEPSYRYSYIDNDGQIIVGIGGIPLDLVNGGWVNTMCTVGREVAYYTTTILVDKYFDAPGYERYPAYLGYMIGEHVASVLWPWGDHKLLWGYDFSTFESMRQGYQYYHTDSTGTYPIIHHLVFQWIA